MLQAPLRRQKMSSEIESKSKIHPLVAGAAAAVIIASGVGVAAITGNLPGSKADPQPASVAAPAQQHAAKPAHPQSKNVQVASAPSAQHAKACPACGVVTAVNEVEVKGKGTGVGAVGGAVVGGVVAHEVFDG